MDQKKVIEEIKNDKKCQDHCPNCNAGGDDIIWLSFGKGNSWAWQNATCIKCGQNFSEAYIYTFTECRHNK